MHSLGHVPACKATTAPQSPVAKLQKQAQMGASITLFKT
jgi:hypothetical protein